MENKKGNVVIIILIVVVLAILVLGYLGRHKIKSMLGVGGAAPVATDNTMPATSPAAAGTSDNIYLTKTDATKGKYMTDVSGMTLYTFDKDTAGVSNCTAGCLKIWPVYTSGAVNQGTFPTNISVITGSDKVTKQFAWKGMPLYYYSRDTKAGDLTGDGIQG